VPPTREILSFLGEISSSLLYFPLASVVKIRRF